MGLVIREGGHVVRPAGRWTPAVHRLLRHLRSCGIPVPAPIRITHDGREVLSFLTGTVPSHPMPQWVWQEIALVSAASLLRRIHDATQEFDRSGPWRSPTHEPAEVLCHNDFATYNLIHDHRGEVTGVIDWDFASPGPRLWDLAYLAYRIVPLSDDEGADTPAPEQRQRRLRLLLETYGSTARPAELHAVLADRLLELADLSDRMADELGNPELHDHAAMYRRDAARLRP